MRYFKTNQSIEGVRPGALIQQTKTTSDPDSVWFLGLEVCSQSLLLGMLTLIFLSFRKIYYVSL